MAKGFGHVRTRTVPSISEAASNVVLIYMCNKCKYKTYSLDSFDHHICFSGTMHAGMKYKKRSQKQKGAQSTSGQKGAQSTSGQKHGGDSVLEVPVKQEKDEDEDIIVLDCKFHVCVPSLCSTYINWTFQCYVDQYSDKDYIY